MDIKPKPATVAIIGAGPAGLMAAERLSSVGIKVMVYDQMPSVGRKFLLAGRGGLNLTHSEPLNVFKEKYKESSPRLGPILERFSPQDLRDWCESLGQETFIGTSGRIFPKALKASPLLRAWLGRLTEHGVTFYTKYQWTGWSLEGHLTGVTSDQKPFSIKADATILALGGGSWPRLGSNGAWVNILKQDGVTVNALKPSNCGFIVPWSAPFGVRFAGHPVKPLIVSLKDIKKQGEAMITERGMEGGVIYALSAQLRDVLEKDRSAQLSFDLRPGLSESALRDKLDAPRGSQSTSNFLRKVSGLSPAALGLMRESLNGTPLPTDPTPLAQLIKKTTITFTGLSEIERAISTAGGIAWSELDDYLMLKKRPGVFAIGEMVDWEAPTGGFLLQASFSMAVQAAAGVLDFLGKTKT